MKIKIETDPGYVHLAANTQIYCAPSITAEKWMECVKEVGDIISQLRDAGGDTVSIRFVNEVNENTPVNQDRNFFYFRVRAYSKDARPRPGFDYSQHPFVVPNS